jgi:acyl transferase domain-containing protein/aryl carrier-like protein
MLHLDIKKNIFTDQVFDVQEIRNNDVAVIGISGKFPESKDVNEYWDMMIHGKCVLNELPDTRKEDLDKYMRNIHGSMEYQLQKASYIDQIDLFDCDFFEIVPSEAKVMDPNQRLFLQTAYSALEDAGYGGDSLRGSNTGVFVGYSEDSEYLKYVQDIAPSSKIMATSGNIKSIVASRISYIMDFHGPSMMIDTACSSSLVAIHMACQSLIQGDCDYAIAGGVKLLLLPVCSPYKLGIESEDGFTRTFDDQSSGTNPGEGVGAVVLKPLSQAIKDKDAIYAVIKGSAVNQDGASNGITAPNPAAQVQVIKKAWKRAGITPDKLQYMEAHGTGTRLGDPIEVEALQKCFFDYDNKKKQTCALGTVKTNIGHLDTAAGIAGFIRVLLMLQHGKIPPIVHFKRQNKNINFCDSPFYINDMTRDFPEKEIIRRAGIGAFGMSGTNCHMVIEKYMNSENSRENLSAQIFTLSAMKQEQLLELVDDYWEYISSNLPVLQHENLCYTAAIGRGHYTCRLAVIASNLDELLRKLEFVSKHPLEECNVDDIFYKMSKRKETEFSCVQYLVANRIIPDEYSNMDKTDNESYKKDKQVLRSVCSAYVEGEFKDWNDYYSYKIEKVHLPVYRFEKRRCWLEVPDTETALQKDSSRLFYKVIWKNAAHTYLPAERKTLGNVIVFMKQLDPASEKIDLLRKNSDQLIIVIQKKKFRRLEDTLYEIGTEETDYQQLFQSICIKGINRIVHMNTICSEEPNCTLSTTNTKQQSGIMSLFYLAKCLSAFKKEIELDVVTEYANAVTGEEKTVLCENNLLTGLCRCMSAENHNLRCRCIDVDETTDFTYVVNECIASSENNIAYRKNTKYLEEIQEAELKSDHEVPMKSEGVYIITGGFGGIGMALIHEITTDAKINIAILSRSKLPEKSEWDKIIESDSNQEVVEKIRFVQKLEAGGSQVDSYPVDVSDESKMREVFDNLHQRFGNVNGVIHCAGIAGDGFLKNKSVETLNDVLKTRVQGSLILDELTKSDELDWFILCASATTFLSVPGQADYCAANNFMRAFNQYRTMQGKTSTIIYWGTWKETGMAVRYGVNKDSVFKALTTKTAAKAFHCILRSEISEVLVGEINYEQITTIHNIDSVILLSDEITEKIQKAKKHKREVVMLNIKVHGTNKQNPNVPLTEKEKFVLNIWGKILGREEIDLNDNFFDIGGHSLLAIQMEVELQNNGYKASFNTIYDYPTIRLLASHLNHIDE